MPMLACAEVILTSCCLFLLFCLPGSLRGSREAERIFNLVRSGRQDRRQIGLRERLSGLFVSQSGKLRHRLGMTQNEKLRKRFLEAGLRVNTASDIFFAVQAFGILGGGALGSVIPVNTAFWMMAGAVVGFMGPDVWLTAKQKSRRERIRRSIPDMVDLLVVCVSAGLGLDQALLRVAEELGISHPEITEELARVALERQAGASRVDTWKALAERIKVEELSSFVNMLSETDRFGTPIVKALNEFSEEVRISRKQRAEEAAAKTKIKIIFPLVLCIFPCIFIVLLAPALLSIAHGLGSMGK